MKSTLLALPILAIASAAWFASAGTPTPTDTIETVDYTFRELPIHSMGVKSLAELRGKPVLIDFWGQH